MKTRLIILLTLVLAGCSGSKKVTKTVSKENEVKTEQTTSQSEQTVKTENVNTTNKENHSTLIETSGKDVVIEKETEQTTINYNKDNPVGEPENITTIKIKERTTITEGKAKTETNKETTTSAGAKQETITQAENVVQELKTDTQTESDSKEQIKPKSNFTLWFTIGGIALLAIIVFIWFARLVKR